MLNVTPPPQQFYSVFCIREISLRCIDCKVSLSCKKENISYNFFCLLSLCVFDVPALIFYLLPFHILYKIHQRSCHHSTNKFTSWVTVDLIPPLSLLPSRGQRKWKRLAQVSKIKYFLYTAKQVTFTYLKVTFLLYHKEREMIAGTCFTHVSGPC